MRTPDELMESGAAVLHQGIVHSGGNVAPLLSGGHDSLCATFIASKSRWFNGTVHHIDTGIGAAYVRRFVDGICSHFGWDLKVWKSPATYDRFIAANGFPGPGAHGWIYNHLKDRCVGYLTRGRRKKTTLVTGCREQESVRRMGFVQPVKVGELAKSGKHKGKMMKRNRVWTAPCFDWSVAEQQAFMDEFGLPTNKLKIAVGLSGECFCGAFAQPGEIELIKEHATDVAERINTLQAYAKRCGTPCVWGTRPSGQLVVAETGPMCSACDQRAAASGIVIAK